MTALQLNAELYRAMGEIADNEKLLAKVLAYVKGLVTTQQKDVHTTARIGWAAAAKQAHADGEDKLMAADVFEDEARRHKGLVPVSLHKRVGRFDSQ